MSNAMDLPRAWRGYHPLETEQWFAALAAAHDREETELQTAIRKERMRGEQLAEDLRRRGEQAGAHPQSMAADDDNPAINGWVESRIARSAAAIRRQGEAEAAALRRLHEQRDAEHEAAAREAGRQFAECEAAIVRVLAEADSLFAAMRAEDEGGDSAALAQLQSALAGVQAALQPAADLSPEGEGLRPRDAAADRESGVSRAVADSAHSAKVIQIRLKAILDRVEAAGGIRSAAVGIGLPDAEGVEPAACGAVGPRRSSQLASGASLSAARAAAGVSASRSGRLGKPSASAYWGDLEPYLQDESDPEQLPQHTGPLVGDPRLAGRFDPVSEREEAVSMDARTADDSTAADLAASHKTAKSDDAKQPGGSPSSILGNAAAGNGDSQAVDASGIPAVGSDKITLHNEDQHGKQGATSNLDVHAEAEMLPSGTNTENPPPSEDASSLGPRPTVAPASEALGEEIRFVRERYIVGKTAGQSLLAADGRVLIAKGGRITVQTVADAEREGKLAELVVHMIMPGLEGDAR